MPIKFYLQPNSITPDPTVQSARVKSATTNDLLIPGSIVKLAGSELKFNPANAEEGIYLTHEAGAETKVTELAIRTGVLHKQLQII